ncbi:MAG: cytochrome c biogenesis CcdA family protein [Methanobacteriaceae archaeon]|jgi:cytochrome c-type biogenesis protein|nr:cytochrome c biogenesis CcdA family protein [Methanobacteriaceae archaeon]MDO9627437.1 cytochrome c biogenesis CcdA family protein [Methanobacteriaceae archaeon]
MDIVPLFSFLAGIASVLSPCVLPVIPVLIGYTLAERRKTEILAFVMGLFLIFTITIVLTILFTAAINYYLHYFRIIASIILIVMGIMIIVNKNLFKFSHVSDSNRRGVFGSFLWGILTSLAWAPCYGTYLIALITFSISTGNAFYSALNLLLYTAGFSISILVLGLLVSSANIEKLAKKANLIRKMSGILITWAGIYMIWLALA